MLRKSLAALLVMIAMVLTSTIGHAQDAATPAAPKEAVNVAGKWISEFESQIGQLKYTFDFKVEGEKLTGTAKREADGAEAVSTEIAEGTVKGEDIVFIENLKIQDLDLRIEYKGKIASKDEIKLTRTVGEFGSAEIVAKRAPEPTSKPAM
jgi:hypothetical protein